MLRSTYLDSGLDWSHASARHCTAKRVQERAPRVLALRTLHVRALFACAVTGGSGAGGCPLRGGAPEYSPSGFVCLGIRAPRPNRRPATTTFSGKGKGKGTHHYYRHVLLPLALYPSILSGYATSTCCCRPLLRARSSSATHPVLGIVVDFSR
jgi:hypothetical protein